MSSQPATTTTTATAAARPVAAGPRTARTTIVAAALALGAAAEAAIVLWHPGPPRNDFAYADVAPVRDAAWTAALIDGVSFAVLAVALAVGVCLLAPGRGARWANVGAVLAAVGGILSALGSFGYGAVSWYATSGALSTDTGTALMGYVKDNPGHAAVPEIIGFVLCNVGVLLLAVALWRARSVPRWLPIAAAVLVVAQFAVPGDRVLDVIQAALMACYVVLAWWVRGGARVDQGVG